MALSATFFSMPLCCLFLRALPPHTHTHTHTHTYSHKDQCQASRARDESLSDFSTGCLGVVFYAALCASFFPNPLRGHFSDALRAHDTPHTNPLHTPTFPRPCTAVFSEEQCTVLLGYLNPGAWPLRDLGYTTSRRFLVST